FELEFLKRFRFRCDCFWTNKSTASNFRTEVTSEGVAANAFGAASQALATSHAPAESKMNLRYKKFTTRFGIVMLF
ncbi:MAG: hypothetical protein LBI30_00315, partial [Holosporales bacterium]|nr:hypothetical protein [Holosporales bacterium]